MVDVNEVYKVNLEKGMTQKDAAKLAQEQTGLALRTGLPIKGPSPKIKKKIGSLKTDRFGSYSKFKGFGMNG